MLTSPPTATGSGRSVYRQHYHDDRDDSHPLPQSHGGLTQLEGIMMAVPHPECSRTTSAGVWQQSEIRATGSQLDLHVDNCHNDHHDDAPGGEPERCVGYYPLTLSGSPARKPRRSFSETDLVAASHESSFRDDVRDTMEPPEVRRCETFTRHMLRQLGHQASATDPNSDSSDDLLPLAVVPAGSCEMRVVVQPCGQLESGGASIRGQRKKKTMKADGSTLSVKQQKRRPSAISGCHHSLSVTGRRYGSHLLLHDAARGSEAATNGCELDASLNASPSHLRCRQATTMLGSRRQLEGLEGCSLQVNAATRTPCSQGEVRKASSRSLADVVALWEEFLTAAFN